MALSNAGRAQAVTVPEKEPAHHRNLLKFHPVTVEEGAFEHLDFAFKFLCVFS